MTGNTEEKGNTLEIRWVWNLHPDAIRLQFMNAFYDLVEQIGHPRFGTYKVTIEFCPDEEEIGYEE